MPDPREAAMRALMQIRSGADSPVARLARMAAERRPLPQDYYDPEAEAADSLDEYDWGANPTPGDPFPDRAPDPGDETRAAAIDKYNRGPKPNADPMPYMGTVEEIDPMRPEPRNAAEAVDALGPIFAQLQNDYGSRDPLGPSAVEIPGYQAAGAAPRVGGIEEELDPMEAEPDDDEDDILAMMRRR